jgi:hypothetical protein
MCQIAYAIDWPCDRREAATGCFVVPAEERNGGR